MCIHGTLANMENVIDTCDHPQEFVKARPIHILELALANVRPDPSGKQRFIITMHNQKTYT